MPTIPLLPGRARGRRAAAPAARAAAVTVASAVASALAAAGLLTACGSAAPQQAAPSASGQHTQEADSAPSPVTGSSTVPGMSGLAVCQSATLKVALDTSQAGGAMGSAYYPVTFTNTSAAPCGMYGYPDLSFVTSAGSSGIQIGAAAQENPSFGRLAVRVRPAVSRTPGSRSRRRATTEGKCRRTRCVRAAATSS